MAQPGRHLGPYFARHRQLFGRSSDLLLLHSATMSVLYILCILVLSCLQCVFADSNGMVMSMDGPMAVASGKMIPYLHFTPGDNLWFLGWVPQSAGAMVGVCIGLFLLALVERWIAACRSVMEVHWSKRQFFCAQVPFFPILIDRRTYRGQMIQSDMVNRNATSLKATIRTSPPFIPAHDLTRGMLHVVQATLGFLFMLTVMTFQVGFIFAIVVGLGVGETLFGRYASSALHIS